MVKRADGCAVEPPMKRRASAAARLPFAAKISTDSRRDLERWLSFHAFPEGEGVVEKGQVVSGAYFVLAGKLRVWTLAPSGRESTLYSLAPGDTCILAINSLFNDLLYPAWVRTEEPTELAIVPGPVYKRLFENETSVRELTIAALSGAVFRLMAELEEVHSCTLDQRLANLILTHAAASGELRLTQQAIASRLGTTREVVARLVTALVAQRAIRSERGKVTILDCRKLQQRRQSP